MWRSIVRSTTIPRRLVLRYSACRMVLCYYQLSIIQTYLMVLAYLFISNSIRTCCISKIYGLCYFQSSALPEAVICAVIQLRFSQVQPVNTICYPRSTHRAPRLTDRCENRLCALRSHGHVLARKQQRIFRSCLTHNAQVPVLR